MYGYIHNVSPILISQGNIRYFTAMLQQETDYQVVTVLNAHYHGMFNDIQDSRTPVRFRNSTVSTMEPDELSVLVDSNTDVEVIDSLPFPVHCPSPLTEDCGLQTLGAVLQNPSTQYQVKIQICARASQEGRKPVKTEAQDLTASPHVVSETTGGVHFTAWRALKLDVDQWYDVNNLSIHTFDGALSLSTTRSTTATPTENRATPPQAPAVEDDITTYTGEVIGASATVTHVCPRHHTLVTLNWECKNTPCAPCEMHYKNSKFTKKYDSVITVELSDKSVKVFKFADGSCATVVPPSLWTTNEGVIQHLLALDMVDLKVRNNEIISCSPCTTTT